MEASARSGRSAVAMVLITVLIVLGVIGTLVLSGPVDIVNNNNNDRSQRLQLASEELAKLATELKRAPAIDEPTLDAVLNAVMRRAREGDVTAAAFVFRVAQIQREAVAESQPAAVLR